MDGALQEGICSPARRITMQIVACGANATSSSSVFLGMALFFDVKKPACPARESGDEWPGFFT